MRRIEGDMRRREFLSLIGVAVVQPHATHAQQRVRRMAVLLPATPDDSAWQARLTAFHQALAVLGWTIGRNINIDTRWASSDAAELRRHAAELAALAPEVTLAGGNSTLSPLLQATRAIPIVFTLGVDPVGAGVVDSLARPGGNVTGFMAWEFSIAGKWVELLKQIAPRLTRIAILRDASQAFATSLFAVMQAVAPSQGLEVIPINMRDAGQIEAAIETFARMPNGGLITTASAAGVQFRDLIIKLAERHKLPAMYWERVFVAAGGLVSYGTDLVDEFRQAASYVDRILKGEKAAELPVQAPTKYELIINLKTAKALDLVVQPTLLARADEVIE